MLGVRKRRRELKVRVEAAGPERHTQMLNAALAGLGLAYVRRTWRSLIWTGVSSPGCSRIGALRIRLPPLLPSRRQSSPAFALLVDALRTGVRPGDERERHFLAQPSQPPDHAKACSSIARRVARSRQRLATGSAPVTNCLIQLNYRVFLTNTVVLSRPTPPIRPCRQRGQVAKESCYSLSTRADGGVVGKAPQCLSGKPDNSVE